MPISEEYDRQVRLLLAVLPHVYAQEDFALKGGTAINFYYRDGPRLSVDIDLHYLPDHDREAALTGISENIKAIADGIKRSLPGAAAHLNSNTANGLVSAEGATVKIEPNTVIRGTLLPPVIRTLSATIADRYDMAPRARCLDHAEVYAGKLCAALQRQHPRDLFDVMLLLESEGLTRELIDVFLVYLISQGKPIVELLKPNIKNIERLYERQFAGMTELATPLSKLKEVQRQLPKQIRSILNDNDRQFLLSFKRGEPDWSLLRYRHAENLPAVRWKQHNLQRMAKNKRQQANARLQELLESE